MAGEVIVIGAGAGGLAVAATLGRHGVRCTVLESSGEVGGSWRSRYDSLRLHTIRWLSGLPGGRVPRRFGRWVGRDDYTAYLQEYARAQHLHVELRQTVERIDRTPDGWLLTTTAGPREAESVVIATGYNRRAVIPNWPGRAQYERPLIHSVDYREPSGYAGKQVLVVGAGNSATEIAVDLVNSAALVQLAVRTPPNIVRRDTHGFPSQLVGIAIRRMPERALNPLLGLLRRLTVPDLTAFGLPAPPGNGFSQFLQTRTTPILDHGFVQLVRERRIEIVAAVERLDATAVHLVDGTALTPDAVICATGYSPALVGLVGHLDVLDPSGRPRVHGAATVPQAPRLYFVGIDVQLAGLLREIGLEARAVGRAIGRQSSRSTV